MKSDGRTNGHVLGSNGSSGKVSRTSSKQEEEVVRLIIQSLSDMGYEDAVQSLSRESGVKVESAQVENFKRAVLMGDWAVAERSIQELELSEPLNNTHVLFLIREQKFLELLEASSSSAALHTLRTEISPLNHDTDRLHFLSSLVMVISPDDLRTRANWSGAGGDSRALLLRQISSYISPNSMIPDARLMTLLESARQVQVLDCAYHTSREPTSFLIPGHKCPRSVFPLHTSHVLCEHTDEVWRVQYSPAGKYLATSGADGLIAIHDTVTMRPLHLLNKRTSEEIRRDSKDGRFKGVVYMTFSPDETMLMTCSQDNVITQWDIETGSILNQISKTHTSDPVSCASWLPEPNTGFVSGGLDKKINLYDDRGDIIHTWEETGRIYDIKLSNDRRYMVAITTDSAVYVFDLTTKERCGFLSLDFELTSLTLSKDSSHMLLSLSPKPNKSRSSVPKSQAMEVQEWSFPDLHLVRRFKGQKQGEFVIRSTYAGYNEQFVMSGSEDSDVYLWHRFSGRLLERISGHTKAVSAISWNPTAVQWASASDDWTVRVWEVEREIEPKVEDGPDLAVPLNGHGDHSTRPESSVLDIHTYSYGRSYT